MIAKMIVSAIAAIIMTIIFIVSSLSDKSAYKSGTGIIEKKFKNTHDDMPHDSVARGTYFYVLFNDNGKQVRGTTPCYKQYPSGTYEGQAVNIEYKKIDFKGLAKYGNHQYTHYVKIVDPGWKNEKNKPVLSLILMIIFWTLTIGFMITAIAGVK